MTDQGIRAIAVWITDKAVEDPGFVTARKKGNRVYLTDEDGGNFVVEVRRLPGDIPDIFEGTCEKESR